MAGWFSAILAWLRGLLFRQELEITLLGCAAFGIRAMLTDVSLQNAGKTSLVNVLAAGQFSEEMVPTIGFNMRKVTKGGVTIKLWDLGGQARFRSMWARYCRGTNAILFMVDSADVDKLDSAKTELHELMNKPELASIPLLVLANKNDLPNALKVTDIIKRLDLAKLSGRECSAYSISAAKSTNIDAVLSWMLKRV